MVVVLKELMPFLLMWRLLLVSPELDSTVSKPANLTSWRPLENVLISPTSAITSAAKIGPIPLMLVRVWPNSLR